MNFKKYLLTTAAAATALVGMVSVPAQAFNLGKTFTLDKETIFDFEFKESHGYFQSNVGLIGPGGVKTNIFGEVMRSDNNSNANDWQGTCGIAVTNCTKSVTLAAGTYSFFLDRKLSNGSYSSISDYDAHFYNEADAAWVLNDKINPANPNSNQKWRIPTYSTNSKLALTPSSASTNPLTNTILIGFEDFGLPGTADDHIDYNDMMITAKARIASVPEPTTLAGLGLIAGALAVSRTRRRSIS